MPIWRGPPRRALSTATGGDISAEDDWIHGFVTAAAGQPGWFADDSYDVQRTLDIDFSLDKETGKITKKSATITGASQSGPLSAVMTAAVVIENGDPKEHTVEVTVTMDANVGGTVTNSAGPCRRD